MAWRRLGDKPLSELMMVSLLTHICPSASASYRSNLKMLELQMSCSDLMQCSKLSQKSCQSSCLESQIINIKLKKILKKVPGPPPKLSASGRRTGSNLEHCLMKTRTTRTPAFWGYPPPPHDYPYHQVILDPKSKEEKVKVTNLKNSPKFQIFEFWNKHYTIHAFWSCLIRCANMKWIWWVLLKIQSGHDSVHRRTDGQGETSIPPFNFVEAAGIIKIGHHQVGNPSNWCQSH